MYNLRISHKNEFIEHIKDTEEIGIMNKGDYTVIQYNVETPRLFDNPYAVESRGIVFCNKTGKVLRRPLPKFKNVNQSPETLQQVLDIEAKPLHVFDKLDGTMIAPFFLNGRIFWGTKRCSEEFNDFIQNSGIITQNYIDFVVSCSALNITPIFEYHDPDYSDSCIVIDYKARFLKLLACRDMFTGEFKDPSKIPNSVTIPKVQEVFPTFRSIKDAITDIEHMKEIEGFVIHMSNGKIVKLKTHWYVSRHNLIDIFSSDRKLCLLFLDYLKVQTIELELDCKEFDYREIILKLFDNGDDICSALTDTQIKKFDTNIAFVCDLIKKIQQHCSSMKVLYNSSHKEYSLNQDNKVFSNLVFRSFTKDDYFADTIRQLEKSMLKDKKFQELKTKHSLLKQ